MLRAPRPLPPASGAHEGREAKLLLSSASIESNSLVRPNSWDRSMRRALRYASCGDERQMQCMRYDGWLQRSARRSGGRCACTDA